MTHLPAYSIPFGVFERDFQLDGQITRKNHKSKNQEGFTAQKRCRAVALHERLQGEPIYLANK